MGGGDVHLPAGRFRGRWVHSLRHGEPGDEGRTAPVSRAPRPRLLRIDPDLVESEIRLENLESGEELYPHIYGELDLSAVTGLEVLGVGVDGEFVTPTLLVPARSPSQGTLAH